MNRALGLWTTAGVALTSAGIIAVTPFSAPLPDVQMRSVHLTDYAEVDLSQLLSTTTTNFDALQGYFSSNPFTTDPDVAQGFTTVLHDLITNTANPVTNPISLLTEGALGGLSGSYAPNAAFNAFTGVAGNIESAISGGSYSTVLNDLELAPTTIVNAFLNGSTGAAGSDLISPEFGLLTNPNGSDLATGGIYAFHQLATTLADELSAVGGGDLTTTTGLIGPGNLDVSVNLDAILNSLGSNGNLTLPISLDSLLNTFAGGAGGDLTLPVTLDGLLAGAGTNGEITLPVSLDTLLAGATGGANGSVTLPISLDSLLSGVATNGDINLPITPDTVLGDVLGHGGSISVPAISVSTIVNDLGNPSYQVADIFGHKVVISLSSFLNDVGFLNSSITPPAIPDSSILSTLESALGGSGNTDISVPLSDLTNALGTAGSQPISVSTATLEGLLGTSGSNPIMLSVSELQTLLGAAGSNPISLPVSDIESVLGTFGSNDLSLPLSELESLLPPTLSLDLPIPEVSGTFAAFQVDLSQDLLSVLGSIAPLSSALPTLLTPDPMVDLASLLTTATSDLGLPISIIGGTLPADLTGIVAHILSGLVP